MSQSQHLLRGAVALVAMATGAAWPCGLEEASGVELQRVAMNLAFPGASEVLGATHKAQRSGVLPRDRKALAAHSAEDEARAELALAKATVRLRAQAVRSGGAQALSAARPGVSIVLLQHMLWSRISPSIQGVQSELHTEGPRPGDVVLVADTPVLEALASRRIGFTKAIELGLVRLYGPAEATQRARQWLASGTPQIQSAITTTGGRS